MHIESSSVLPEVKKLEKRRERPSKLEKSGKQPRELIDPALLQSADFLEAPEVAELLAIKEVITLLGGKLNPVEMVTIDNVDAQKNKFLAVFGTEDETGVNFAYQDARAKSQKSLTEGLLALGHESAEELSLSELTLAAGAHVKQLREQLKNNRLSIRSHYRSGSYLNMSSQERSLLTAKLAANMAVEGLVADLSCSLQLIQGLSQQDDSQIAEATGHMYGRSVSPALRAAAQQYLAEVPQRARDRFVGNGISGLLQDEFDALVLAETKELPSTAKGVEELNKLREKNDPRALLYADSKQIRDAFAWICDKLYEDYEERTGATFPKEQRFTFDIGNYSGIDVRDKSSLGKAICIPQNRIVTLKTLYELMIHEIESHVLQSYLSDLVIGLGGGKTKPDQEIVYEGLALTRETLGSLKFLGIESKLPESRALYILAMDLAVEGKSFWEVAHFIYSQSLDILKAQGVAEEDIGEQAKGKAWNIAYRVFRGHQQLDGFSPDTAYAFTKDAAYLNGILLVDQMNKKGMGNLASVAISHVDALSLLSRFDISDDKMPIMYRRHSDEYFREFLHPRLRDYVQRTKQA